MCRTKILSPGSGSVGTSKHCSTFSSARPITVYMFSERLTLPLELATGGSLSIWSTKGYVQPLKEAVRASDLESDLGSESSSATYVRCHAPWSQDSSAGCGEHWVKTSRELVFCSLPFPVGNYDTEAKEIHQESFLCTVSIENDPMKARDRKISFGISPTLRKFKEKQLDFASSVS